MYLPAHFAEQRSDVLQALIREHPLGTLVTQDAEGLTANHVPFLMDATKPPFGTLIGHVARANPVWRELDGKSVFVIFHGPSAYISPNWYPSKQEHGKAVPTWNYAVVHTHGIVRIVEDKSSLHGIVARLTQTHEQNLERQWAIGDAPPDYIEQMLGAIVGLEIAITRLEGKFKLGQNRSFADREGMVRALAAKEEPIVNLTRAHSLKP